MSLLFKNAHLFAPEALGPGSVLVEDGGIAAVYRMGERVPSVENAIDLCGAALGPGFMDLHTHGADGVEMMDGGEAVTRMGRFFVRHGVTGFFPSTVTASFEAVEKAMASVRQAMAAPTGGARALGVHLEGPFLSPQRLGAQSPEFCVSPTPERLARLLDITAGVSNALHLNAEHSKCIVTVAPEVEGAMAAIETIVQAGHIVSIGHTVATVEQAEAAFAVGARQVTHMFNGMPPLHHREPGVVAAALATKGVMIELIADGVHLHPATIRMAIAAKGVDETLLVTDSMAATGCADGEYILGPMKVVVKNGEARLPSGALAGSTLTLERAVVNVARWTEVYLSGAWQMASLNPARQVGLDGRLGRLAVGYDADLTALNAAGEAVLTVVGGEVVYRA